MKFLLSLLFISGCFLGGGLREPAPRLGEKGSKVVDRIWYNPDPNVWKRSPWYNLHTDVVTPFRVVISTTDWACIMDIGADEPRHLDNYICKSGWRPPSKRNAY